MRSRQKPFFQKSKNNLDRCNKAIKAVAKQCKFTKDLSTKLAPIQATSKENLGLVY